MSSDDELEDVCSSVPIFSSVEAVISDSWIQGFSTEIYNTILDSIEDMGMKIKRERKHFILKGSLDQVIAAEKKLATYELLCQGQTAKRIACRVSTSVESALEGASSCVKEELGHESSVLDASLVFLKNAASVEDNASLRGDLELGVSAVQFGISYPIGHRVTSSPAVLVDTVELSGDDSISESELLESCENSIREFGTEGFADRSDRTNIVGFEDPSGGRLDGSTEKRATERTCSLSVDKTVWDYIEAMEKVPVNFLQELRISYRRENQDDLSTIHLQPVNIDDNSFDFELLDVAHDQILQVYGDTQSDCFIEECKLSFDEAASEQLLEEVRPLFKDVLMETQGGTCIFVGPLKSARAAKKCFEKTVHGARFRSSAVDRRDGGSTWREKMSPISKTLVSPMRRPVGGYRTIENDFERSPESEHLLALENETSVKTSVSSAHDARNTQQDRLPVQPSLRNVSQEEKITVVSVASSHASEKKLLIGFGDSRSDGMGKPQHKGKSFDMNTVSDITPITDSEQGPIPQKESQKASDERDCAVGACVPNIDSSDNKMHIRSDPERQFRAAKIDAAGISYEVRQQPQSMYDVVNSTDQYLSELTGKPKRKVIVTRRQLPKTVTASGEFEMLTDMQDATTAMDIGHQDRDLFTASASGKTQSTKLSHHEVPGIVAIKPLERTPLDLNSDEEHTERSAVGVNFGRLEYPLGTHKLVQSRGVLPRDLVYQRDHQQAKRPLHPRSLIGRKPQNEADFQIEYLLSQGDEAALAALLDRKTGTNTVVTPERTAVDAVEAVGFGLVEHSSSSEEDAFEVTTTNETFRSEKQATICHLPQPEDGSWCRIVDAKVDLPGFRGLGTIAVTVNFDSGVEQHQPRKSYLPLNTTFYLPASGYGKQAHRLMKRAFDSRQLFRVDYRDSEIGNLVSNGVEMKTDISSYPDDSYLARLIEQLEELLVADRSPSHDDCDR